MYQYHLKIWEHFSDFIDSEIGNLSLKFPFVSLLSDKLPKEKCWLSCLHRIFTQAKYFGIHPHCGCKINSLILILFSSNFVLYLNFDFFFIDHD
jgi:hypothetical protein